MRIECPRLILRPWQEGDEDALVRHANNRKVWRNLRDLFPHPYTRADADDWIRRQCESGDPPQNLAIVREGEPIGGVGLRLFSDVMRRVAEIGYWLGEAHWGRGYMTEAVKEFTRYAFTTFEVDRLEAGVFGWNDASCRVLEKVGYRFEARLAQCILKDGETTDRLLYVRFRERRTT